MWFWSDKNLSWDGCCYCWELDKLIGLRDWSVQNHWLREETDQKYREINRPCQLGWHASFNNWWTKSTFEKATKGQWAQIYVTDKIETAPLIDY